MPQFDQVLGTYASQIFWLLIVFGLIYFGIGCSMLPKIEGTVDARNAKIADDLAAAERARATADATEEAWRSEMAKSRAEAQAETAKAKAKAIADAEARVKKADAATAEKLLTAETAIKASTAKALGNIEAAAAEAAQEIVSKLSGTTVSAVAAQSAVKEALSRG